MAYHGRGQDYPPVTGADHGHDRARQANRPSTLRARIFFNLTSFAWPAGFTRCILVKYSYTNSGNEQTLCQKYTTLPRHPF